MEGALKITQETLDVETRGRGLYDLTDRIAVVVARASVRAGLCIVFVQHTSASLVIQENADRAVREDLERWMSALAPEDPGAYAHADEGPDDMPAHLRSAVTRTNETIPVRDGALALGTWQAVYLWEHRHAAHRRRVVVHVMGL